MGMVKRNKKHILGIIGALLLVLFITPFLPGTASAVKNVENMYAVVVTTGNDAGNGVSYFGLQYEDTDGYTHVEYIFPHKGALQDSFKVASNGNFVGEKALERGKTNTYFIEPAFEVAHVIGLEIYCQGIQGELYAWDVSGLRLYRVDQVIDVVSNGKDYSIRFNGSQLAYLEERSGNGGVTFSWTGNTLFQLQQSGTASHRLVFETIPYSMEQNYDYVIRMDIADVNGAGFEKMNQAYNAMEALRDVNFGEYMAIQIEYTDIFGDMRIITQPVMTSAISWMMENGISGDTKMAGFAQQGDTIAFGCSLQDMQEIKAITLNTGTEADALLTESLKGVESASFTGISVYKESAVSVGLPSMENYAGGPEYYFSGDPLFYHTAASKDGETVAENSSHYISMRPYQRGALLTPNDSTEKYLVELIADPTQITRPPTDLMVELRYVDMSGAVRTSDTYSVRSETKEFYGHWPASTDNFGYVGQVASDSGVCFVIELSDVEHFAGLTISVPMGSSDWQMAGFEVMRIDTVSKRLCVWENVISNGAMSNRRYFRNVEGYTVFSMEEKALIQPGEDCDIDFVSQSVQQAEDFDWSAYRYSMTYDQCTSNLGLAKVRENYTVEVHVQSGSTSLLDGYGDNGSKNRFYFMLEFENGVSGYVLANQQLSADGFRSGCTESFIVSTNYDYGNLVSVHVIPDDISEGSDPYDKLNIAEIRVRQNESGSISKEWIIQNVGWIGIDYQDEGAGSSIGGQQGRKEVDIARIYPVSYNSYALNLEFRMGVGSYTESGSGGAFYGTIEGTLEYYNKDGKRNQLTFDVVRAMYDYANKTPLYLNDSASGSTGSPLAVTDNSFMFRENHTDRFIISVSDVSSLGKLTLNMKSINGGSLQITNVTVALVMEGGVLQINEQDEYLRMCKTEYLCEDTVDKIPAFELFLPTDRNVYQEIYFTEHEPIKLDTENSTWISAVSRVPNSRNDTVNVFVYPAEDAAGVYDISVRAQYTDFNGNVLETGASKLEKRKDANGKTIYSVSGLTATSMSTLNRVFVKAQTSTVVSAYIDHVIVQQIRGGVVVNTFYMNCQHKNAEMEFYAVPTNLLDFDNREQKVYLTLGEETEEANLLSENRDVAVALRYTTVSGGEQEFASQYIYITDQQYQTVKAGDMIELTFNEPYVQDIVGITVATSGNIKAHVEMACADSYSVDAATEKRQLIKHFSFPVGATVKNKVVTLENSDESTVEILDIQFVTAMADAYLESGTTDPIAMVVGYTDSQGVERTTVVADIRNYVVSEGEAFSTGSTTQIRLLLRDVVSLQYLQLMPYDMNPQTTAGWKPSQMVVSVGADGSVQKVNRSIDTYIVEDVELFPDEDLVAEMVGGLKVNLTNIIITADVRATNESGNYGVSHRVSSAGNKTLALTVSSGASIKLSVNVSNSKQGYTASADQSAGLKDISGLITTLSDGIKLTLPKNTTGQDQQYRIIVSSKENELVMITIELTVKSGGSSQQTPDDATETTDPTKPTEPNEPTEPEEPSTEPTEPSGPSTESTEPTGTEGS